VTAEALPARQPREQAVPCSVCRQGTWNLDVLCDTCRSVLPRTKDLNAAKAIDDAVCTAVVALAGERTPEALHTALLDRMLSVRNPLAIVLTAALLDAHRRTDTIGLALDELEAAHWDRETDTTYSHEDIPHHMNGDGFCDTCRGIARDRLAEALAEVKVLLGDAVLRDLTTVAR